VLNPYLGRYGGAESSRFSHRFDQFRCSGGWIFDFRLIMIFD
jgi:hypothetical protein